MRQSHAGRVTSMHFTAAEGLDRWDTQQWLMEGFVHIYYFPVGSAHTHTHTHGEGNTVLPLGCCNYCSLNSIVDRRSVSGCARSD